MWTKDGSFLYEGDRLPGDREATQAEVEAWLAKLRFPTISFNDWLALFTEAERTWAFSSNDAQVREMIARGSAANVINLSSPTVAAFLDLVISLGSPLTTERKAQVLAGIPPA